MRQTAMTMTLVAVLLGLGPAAARAQSGSCDTNLMLKFGTTINTQFDVCLSPYANVANFTFYGTDYFQGAEGYIICTPDAQPYPDYGIAQPPWIVRYAPPVITQPNGPGKLPITITRTTGDGRWKLVQTYAKDNTEGDFTITMALTNLTGQIVGDVQLGRWNMFFVGADSGTTIVSAGDSLFATQTAGKKAAVTLQAVSRTISHTTRINTVDTSPNCTDGTEGVQNAIYPSGRIVYNVGTMGIGATKTVKFTYSRK